MSDISPIRRANAALSIQAVRAHAAALAKSQSSSVGGRGSDSVELSSHAQLLSKLADLPEVRQDVVDRVRGEIDAETYETPEKIEIAMQRLLDELA